ncbi:MAG: hypothetical protein M1831_002412 [Alyxoria varia]|nr:MAG: hypothetical protein M1831_002412 [Alyxoria varia]
MSQNGEEQPLLAHPEEGQINEAASGEDPPERRYLIRKPQALQYFHKGVLKKAQEKERVAGRFELFFDLLYVALIANFADHLSEEPSGVRFVKFILVFTPAWHAWADAKENANNYYNDDLLQRIFYLWIMALLVLYGNNANFIEEISALRTTVGAYMLIRFTQSGFFFYYSIASHYHRVQNRAYFIMISVGVVLMIPLLIDEATVSNRVKIALAVAVILWEEFSYILTFGPWIPRWLKLDYSTAVDIEHENDRYTAFTILVLGEFTYAILVGSPARGGLNLGVMRAVWTLTMAFCFNSLYVYCDGAIEGLHPVRRAVWSSYGWLLLHLPLSAGLLLGGHVSAQTVLKDDLSSGQRWLWGGGLGVGMLGMFLLALLYKDADRPGRLLMPKVISKPDFVLLRKNQLTPF